LIDAPIIRELLDKSSLFRGIPPKVLDPIFKQSMQISLDRGEQLLTPGIRNEHVYVIVSGQMGVHLTLSNLDEPFAILKPGDCVGEMSVLVDSTVSAYVIASTPCKLLAIGNSSFWSLIKGSNESARNMLNILVQRIRVGNEMVAETLLHHDNLPVRKSTIDSMTGLYSQSGIQEKFDRMLHLHNAAKQPLYLLLLKIDEVKTTSGGEMKMSDCQPLHIVAQTILSLLRPDDQAARLDGNKFALLLAKLPFADAYAAAEKLRAVVCQIPVRLPDGSSLPPVTISVGVCKENANDTWSALLANANEALERAISAGSNRVSD